ncbi:MAG: MMPL family transporter [Parvularculaceae bacterium]
MLRVIEYFLILWAESARRASWALVALFIAAAGLAGYYAATHLKVNTDTSEMLDPNLPFQKNAAALREAFPQIKTDLVIIARAETLDEADAYAAALRARLLKKPELLSAVFAPAEEPFFLENGLLFLDSSELESRLAQMSKAAGLIETLVQSPTADTFFASLADNDKLAEKSDLGQDTLADIYAELSDVIEASLDGKPRPFSWMGALDTGDKEEGGYIRLVYASPVLDFTRLQPAKPAVEAIRAEIAALNEEFAGRVDVFITGDPALRAEELESVTTGIGLSFTISFFAMWALLFFCFRSFMRAAVTMIALVITLALTSAFAAAFIGELNLVSIAFTVLLTGLGLDFAIHLLLHIDERRAGGQKARQALRGSMHELGPGLFMAATTTALAFFSFVPTDFDGIAQLGVIAGVGVLFAFAVTVTFVPAALVAMPMPAARKSAGAFQKVLGFLDKVSAPVAIATVLLGVAAAALVPFARFDADPMSLRNPDSPSVKGFYILFSDEETVPYRLTRIAATEDEAVKTSAAAKALPSVRGARSLPDFVPEDQDEKLELIQFAAGSLFFALEAEPQANPERGAGGALALEERLLDVYNDGSGARLAALLKRAREEGVANASDLIEKNIFAYWPQLVTRLKSQFNADYVDIDSLPDALKTRYRSADGRWRVDILPEEDVRDKKALDRFVTDVEKIFPDVSGGAIQSKKAGDVISASMLEATGIAFAVITVFLWLLVRRPLQVFLMLLPIFLAASLTTAAGVIFKIPFNYANVIVLPLIIGLGVDSGIHLVMRQQQVKAGENVFGTSTPRAVLFSSLTTVASFGSLMLSPHRGTASMGELLSIAIAFTLVCTLIVLPAAFRFGEARATRAEARKSKGA